MAGIQHTMLLFYEGYGRCWWARPGAAELSDQDALALRQHNKRQLQIRRLMPRVMLQLTSTQTDSDQNAAAGKATAGAVAVGAPQGSGDMTGFCPGFLLGISTMYYITTSEVVMWALLSYPAAMPRACCIEWQYIALSTPSSLLMAGGSIQHGRGALAFSTVGAPLHFRGKQLPPPSVPSDLSQSW